MKFRRILVCFFALLAGASAYRTEQSKETKAAAISEVSDEVTVTLASARSPLGHARKKRIVGKTPIEPQEDSRSERNVRTTAETMPYLDEQPEEILFFHKDGMERITLNHRTHDDTASDRTLYLGSAESIKKTVKDRRDRFAAHAPSSRPHTRQDNLRSLARNAYEIVSFKPGVRNDGRTLHPVNPNALAAIQGPDYDSTKVDWENDIDIRKLLSTILSIGHGGEILLKVKEGGFILDEPGADFTLFENAVHGQGLELGAVGVSESDSPTSFRWFSCEPQRGVLHDCFGAVPTAEGGDQFDLAELGLRRIRFIWIKDLGAAKGETGKWPTEGCDLDALVLNHAYAEK